MSQDERQRKKRSSKKNYGCHGEAASICAPLPALRSKTHRAKTLGFSGFLAFQRVKKHPSAPISPGRFGLVPPNGRGFFDCGLFTFRDFLKNILLFSFILVYIVFVENFGIAASRKQVVPVRRLREEAIG